MRNVLLFALTALVAGAAFAQSEARQDPGDPRAPVPPPSYRSVFAEYRPHAEPEIAPWREVNEQVARAGGHSGHAKPAAAVEPAAKPQPQGHEGHR